MIKTTLLFFATALCEIIGCFLPWLWLKRNASVWLLLPAGISLALFVWLLTLHPAASGRVYAAYGGVYVCTALMWLRVVDGDSAQSRQRAAMEKEQWNDTRNLRQKVNKRTEKEWDKADAAFDNRDKCEQSANINAYWEPNTLRCLDRRTGRVIIP